MDAFFASVEQRDNPTLRGKPVAVGGDAERGVVAAASYEARKFGVRSAMSSKVAKARCPNLIFVKPRFEQYKLVSIQIQKIFNEYTDLVEPLSLDEAYLDVTENLKNIPTATETANEIRQRIYETTNLTASAGISFNKFLAKTASDINKPNGIFVIKPHQAESFIENLLIHKFYGVGKVTAKKMISLGIFSGKELKSKSLEYLVQNFGKAGKYYYEISRGEDKRSVNPKRIRKSIGVENTFKNDISDSAALDLELDGLLNQLWIRLEKANTFGKTLTLKLKYADFELISRSRTSNFSLSDKVSISKLAKDIFTGLLPPKKGIRLMGVSISNLNTKENFGSEQLIIDFEN